MLENEEGVQKLKDFLAKNNPQLTRSDVEKIALNLYELGVFLVHLKVKRHSELLKPKSKEFPIDNSP